MSAAVSSGGGNEDGRRLLLGLVVQPPPPPPSDGERVGSIRTLLDLLINDKMDGVDGIRMRDSSSRWRTLRERLGFKGIGCCGVATWRHGSPSSVVDDDNEDDQNGVVLVEVQENPVPGGEEGTPRQQMNLATALAAEREFRLAGSGEDAPPDRTPLRVSLMRLLEETADGCDLERDRERERGVGNGNDDESSSMCCVCMGRKKGAAFIPCGHTFCRVCSRELCLNRGSCPLCNRHILDILDIF